MNAFVAMQVGTKLERAAPCAGIFLHHHAHLPDADGDRSGDGVMAEVAVVMAAATLIMGAVTVERS